MPKNAGRPRGPGGPRCNRGGGRGSTGPGPKAGPSVPAPGAPPRLSEVQAAALEWKLDDNVS